MVQPQYMIRGFNMHEHIDEFGLINMNGRVYDPVLGRFIQADNFVESTSDLQTFNRYSYCKNNPLKYTDPSGNWEGWDDIAAIVIGGGTNVVQNWDHIKTAKNGHGGEFLAGLEYFGVGALAGEAALYGGPLAGALVGGSGNVFLDASRGNFSDPNQKYTILQSFTRGALSGLSGAEAAAEAEELAEIPVEDIPEAFQSTSKFFTKGKWWQKGLYEGTKRSLDDVGKGNYQGTSGDIISDIAANFVSGFVGSTFSDIIGGEDGLNVNGNPWGLYAFNKLGLMYGSALTSNILGEATKVGLHRTGLLNAAPYQSSYFQNQLGGQLNSASFSGLGGSAPEFASIILMTIIKTTN